MIPKISIIIPCYNATAYLDECLTSVQKQTIKKIEIICVDDKSTDNTLSVLRSYAKKDTRIKVFAKRKNEGSGKARNLGIKKATGDYVVFIDPDDYYPDEKTLERLYKAVCKNHVKIAGGNLIVLSSNNKYIDSKFNKNGIRIFSKEPFSYGYTLFIYNREFLIQNKLEFPNYLRFQDPPFFVKTMILAKKYYVITDAVYVYRQSYKSIKWTERRVLDTLNGISDILSMSYTNKLYKLYTEQIEILWNQIARIYEQTSTFDSVKEKIIDLLESIDCDVLSHYLENKLSYKKCYCDLIKKNDFLYKKWVNFIKWPHFISKICRKERLPNGDRHIIFCGLKIINYTRKFKLKGYEYVHICNNDKFIKPFVDFCNRNFDSKKHVFLCQNCFSQFDFPTGMNVIPMKSLKAFDFSSKSIKKIICHSLFVSGILSFLYKHKRLLKHKCFWMIWGGDLYNAPRDKKNDYVRRNFRGYISDTDGDIDVAINKYKLHSAETYDAGYTFPITKEMITNTKKRKHDYVSIQINNSADSSTLDMLEVLSKFRDQNIRVKTILSYGKLEFKNAIIKKGIAIFGDRFEYLDSLMVPSEYVKYLAQNDILILNQNRQQGLGNCFVTLALGKKLFIRSEVTTYNHFNSKGIKVFDTNNIKNMSFSELIKYPKNIEKNNKEKAKIFFEDAYLKKLWAPVFDE